MTIYKARQKLGKRGKIMTDRQVANMLVVLSKLCNKVIDSVVEGK